MRTVLSRHDMVLLHMHMRYPGPAEQLINPPGRTASGIADAVGISRAHATIVLQDLMEHDLCIRRMTHVRGHPRQMYVYELTPAGDDAAETVACEVGSADIDWTEYVKRHATQTEEPEARVSALADRIKAVMDEACGPERTDLKLLWEDVRSAWGNLDSILRLYYGDEE